MKTNSQPLLKKFLITCSAFIITTVVTYGTLSVPTGFFKSTPFSTMDTVSDTQLDSVPGATLALDKIIAKVEAKAKATTSTEAYNNYLDKYLKLVDNLDDSLKSDPDYAGTYSLIFKYIYPRVLTLKKDTSTAVIDKLGGFIEAAGGDGNSNTGGTTTPSCATSPTFAHMGTKTIGTPTSVNQAWTYSATPGNCTYKCTAPYFGFNCSLTESVPPPGNNNTGTTNTGTTPIGTTKDCSGENGTGVNVWNGTSWSICKMRTCNEGYAQANDQCWLIDENGGFNPTPTPTTPPATGNEKFYLKVAKETVNGTQMYALAYKIDKSFGYKKCVMTYSDVVDAYHLIQGGGASVANGMQTGLGNDIGADGTFLGKKNYGLAASEGYINLYCGNDINATYSQMVKIITPKKISEIESSPITTITVSPIPVSPYAIILEADKTVVKKGDKVNISYKIGSNYNQCRTQKVKANGTGGGLDGPSPLYDITPNGKGGSQSQKEGIWVDTVDGDYDTVSLRCYKQSATGSTSSNKIIYNITDATPAPLTFTQDEINAAIKGNVKDTLAILAAITQFRNQGYSIPDAMIVEGYKYAGVTTMTVAKLNEYLTNYANPPTTIQTLVTNYIKEVNGDGDTVSAAVILKRGEGYNITDDMIVAGYKAIGTTLTAQQVHDYIALYAATH